MEFLAIVGLIVVVVHLWRRLDAIEGKLAELAWPPNEVEPSVPLAHDLPPTEVAVAPGEIAPLPDIPALVPDWDHGHYAEAFGLETGPEQLQPFFADIRIERFENGLAVTDAEPVLAYIRSSSQYRGHNLTEARTTVQEAIARHGAFAVAKRQGLVSCRKP